MDSKALEAALVEAAAAAEAHTASLAERLAAVRAAPGGGASAEAARWAAEARDWHASQAARWGGVLVASGGGLCAALGDGKYAPIASEALTAMRPDPPGGRSAPSAAAGEPPARPSCLASSLRHPDPNVCRPFHTPCPWRQLRTATQR